MIYRHYSPDRDKKAIYRMWREAGWLTGAKDEFLDNIVETGRALVAEINNEAECLIISTPGSIQYLDEKLSFAGFTGVTTSRIARRQGLAGKLTAQTVAEEANLGTSVCGLGMFDQGFYNKLGFGTGSYEILVAFDPSILNVKMKPEVPRRITSDDWKEAHKARLERYRKHGSCNLFPPEISRASMLWSENGFGLGYGKNNHLTHYFWAIPENIEYGPYNISWMVFRNSEQFMELMALIKGLSDQVRLIRLIEPPDIQIQDILITPFKYQHITNKSQYQNQITCKADWQLRICNLEECLEKTYLKGEEVQFNLKLIDPIEHFLENKTGWKGLTGYYIVKFSHPSSIEKGFHDSLPTLKASVGAFTRMWMGIRPATGLSITDDLKGPSSLLKKLDDKLCLPQPKLNWEKDF